MIQLTTDEVLRLARFGAVGLCTNLLLYLLFLAFLRLGLDARFSAGVCYLVGVALSYLLNRNWTFRSTSGHQEDIPRFVLAYGIGLASTLLTITILLHFLSAEIAQIINIGITALVVYVSLRASGFARSGRQLDN